MAKLGGNIDSWCGKCKFVLAHTIEAMVGDKPVRVQCNTCKAQHNYKASGPAATASTGRKRLTRAQTLLKGSNPPVPKRYSPQETYSPGDLIEHPNFGMGVAVSVRDSKVEVQFDAGTKVLIQGR